MAKVYELDYEEYPDGIDQDIDLNKEVWDHGYCLETDEGTWYEIYVNDKTKKHYPDLDKSDWVNKFHGLWIGDYQDNNQITFFVPNDEEEFTLDTLHEHLE